MGSSSEDDVESKLHDMTTKTTIPAPTSGAIHMLQEDFRVESGQASSADPTIQAEEIKSDISDNDTDDDDAFVDAPEELSPQRKLSVANSHPSSVQDVLSSGKEKQVFVLSEAGKPIFSLCGNEDCLASVTAVMQALVSYVTEMNDTLTSLHVDGGGTIVFLTKSPLILVVVSKRGESVLQLTNQLT